MNNLVYIPGDYRPGSILAVDVKVDGFGVVTHVGIQGDGVGDDGLPTVIHASKLFGQIFETTMTNFASRAVGPIRCHGYPSNLAPPQILARARSRIGERWSLSQNCEHFTSSCHGFEPNSPQLQAGVVKTALAVGGVIGILLAVANSGGGDEG